MVVSIKPTAMMAITPKIILIAASLAPVIHLNYIYYPTSNPIIIKAVTSTFTFVVRA
jgi:hypothetical protein